MWLLNATAGCDNTPTSDSREQLQKTVTGADADLSTQWWIDKSQIR